MIQLIFDVVLLAAMGLLGLTATGGLPGAPASAQAAAKDAAARLAPFAGIIGIVGLVIGLWALINWFSLISLAGYVPVFFVIFTICWIVLIGLGLILAYPLIAKQLAGGGGQEALDRSLAAVKPYQRPLSFAAVALAVVLLVLAIIGPSF